MSQTPEGSPTDIGTTEEVEVRYILIDTLVESEHPQLGRMREPRPAARFETAPLTDRRPAPALGQHTAEVLAELANR